ncbi:MAG TPA: Gfo/Idh/MocA family oxidoreductase [Paenibacillus sp.]|nr:Gfo/Idh/MocA family oxidoreductase [Paenibacillus sp.]
MMKTFGFGFIGLGGMARAHLRNIKRFEDATVTAVCDVSAEGARAFAAEAGGIPEERIYSDYRSLVADPTVDVIVCVTPNDTHADIIRACLEAGKPFMAEKPFTRTFEEAEALIALYRARPVPNMIGFSYRYQPQFRYARELARSGKLGPIRHAFIQYLQGWGSAAVGTPFVWRFDKAVTGTGTLGDLGSHMIDTARFLIGEFEDVSGRLATIVSERPHPVTGVSMPVEVDDFACFHASLAGGVPAVFQTTRNALGSGNQHEAYLYGDFGTLFVSSENAKTVTWVHKTPEEPQAVREELPVPTEGGVDQWDEFMKVLRGERSDLVTTVEDGYVNQEVMEAIVASERRKAVVSLPYRP